MAKVVMVLAHGPGRPGGDTGDRIEWQACLTPREQLDVDAYYASPSPWPAWHARPGRPAERGEVTRTDGSWALSAEHDDGIAPFEAAAIRPGEIVRLSRPGGAVLLYRIVCVAAD